ncbi:TonB-dependent receptor [soil metagenome]
MISRIGFVAFVCALLLPVATAGSITGVVVDAETDEPVISATVAVYDSGDRLISGGITDMDGRFEISGLPSGMYRADVSYIGYQGELFVDIEVRDGTTTDLGQVALQPEVEMLDGVEVTAARQAVEVRIDRTVYSLADDPIVAGGTATNFLESIPSVDVDIDGNVSLRGSSNVAVLVNGRPAPVPPDMVADWLAQLPADAVDRVEVIPNPSARYEPDGMAGVLNIVLRDDTDPGFGGSVSVRGDTRGGLNTNSLLTYGRGPWSLSASIGVRRAPRAIERSSFRINRLQEPQTSRDELGFDERVRMTRQLGLNAEYAATRNTSLSASFRLSTYDQEDDNRLESQLSDLDQQPFAAAERLVDQSEERHGGDLRAGFSHFFGGEREHALTAEARADIQLRQRNENLLTQPTAGEGDAFREQTTVFDRRDRRAGFDLDYTRPWLGGNLELGYSGFMRLQDRDFRSQSRFEPDTPLEGDVGLSNVAEYALFINAIYGQFGREIGRFGFQGGVRLESAQTDFDLITTNESFRNTYTSAFPSFFLTYELSEADRLRGSYSRRVRRPRTDHLNPFPRFDEDPLNVYVGNPSIRPEYTSAFEFGYVRFMPWGSLTVGPYARFSTDVIQYLVTVREDGAIERTVDNLATRDSYGAEGVLTLDGESYRAFISLEAYQTSTDGAIAGTALQNDAFGWGGRINGSYQMDRLGMPGLVVQASARYRAGMRTEQGRVGSFLFTNLAMRQRLSDRLNLNIRFGDPLGTARSQYILDQPGLYQEVRSDWGAQRIAVTLNYRFNQPDRRQREEMSEDEDFGEVM